MKEKLIDMVLSILPTIAAVIIIYIVGRIVMKITLKIMSRGLEKSHLDQTAHSFILSIVKTVFQVFIVIIILSCIGIPMTSIVTVIGSCGLAIGLALQNSLSNVAGGFIILFSKPFKKGDYVEVSGTQGTVDSISILYTKLITVDNRSVYIPNGQMSNATLINYNEQGTRRLDLVFSISYDNDYHKAIEIISDIISKNEIALKDPEPLVRMVSHSASSIDIAAKVWVLADDYWTLNFELLETIKTEFDKNNISIPYQQLDIHVTSNK